MSDLSDSSDLLDPYGLREASAEVAANTPLCLIHQCTFLLRRQIQTLEKSFVEEGGFTERLYRTRKNHRNG